MKDFEYLEPATVADACALLKQYKGEARAYAGGAYLSIVMKQGLLQPKALVNIKKITALKGIRSRRIASSKPQSSHERSFRFSAKSSARSPISACATSAPSAAISPRASR
jgi:hypothetical protein